jgi:hypothetical protein
LIPAGNNAVEMQTTATYLPETQEFEVGAVARALGGGLQGGLRQSSAGASGAGCRGSWRCAAANALAGALLPGAGLHVGSWACARLGAAAAAARRPCASAVVTAAARPLPPPAQVHTPTTLAQKYWITNSAVHAQWCVVFAQLLVRGQNQGIHGLLVRIRNPDMTPCKVRWVGGVGARPLGRGWAAGVMQLGQWGLRLCLGSAAVWGPGGCQRGH